MDYFFSLPMIDKLNQSATGLFLFLLPIFFIPIGSLSSDYDKQILIIFFSVLLFVLSIIKITLDKKLTFVKTPVDLLILLLSLVFILSTLLFAPNKIASFTSPMGTGTILALAVLFFTLTQNVVSAISGFRFLIVSSVLISILIIIQQLAIKNQQLAIHSLSPLGGFLSAFSFLLIVTVYLVAELLPQITQIKKVKQILPKIAIFAVIATALSISAFHLLTDAKPLLLPFSYGWAIMMEMYKNFQSFLFGVGPANYSFAYTIGRPAALNATAFWNFVFTGGSSYFLTLATEIGAVGAVLFALIALKSLKFPQNSNYQSSIRPYLLALIAALLLQILLPTGIVLLSVTVILLSIAAPKWKTKEFILDKIPSIYPIGLIGLIGLIVIFYQGKVYLANISFRRALVAINDKKLSDAYNFSQTAINYDPYSENYYSLGSSLGLSIAQNLAQNREATDSAKNISFLTQQSVAQARTATQLNSLNSQSWGQLASVYQALIGGSVQGAEQSTLDAYNRQMTLDPVSPLPRIAIGNLFMHLQQYDQAQTFFVAAINLKPDWNIAHHNLAVLYAQTKKYKEAQQELQSALDLTPSDSDDYKKLQKELGDIKPLVPPEATPSAAVTNQQSPAKSSPPPPKPTL